MTLEVGRATLPDGGVRALVTCQSCGAVYGVSPRTFRGIRLDNERRHLAGQAPRLPTCRTCRSPRVVVATDSLMVWWLERFTIMEITEMAEGIWGAREHWGQHEPAALLSVGDLRDDSINHAPEHIGPKADGRSKTPKRIPWMGEDPNA